MATKNDFLKMVTEQVGTFPKNKFCEKADAGKLVLGDYHAMLLMLFHQTFQGPSTFAMAGAHCPLKHHVARDYLLKHADEEKSHWQWVVSDLEKTGYTGKSPLELFPQTACQAYVAFNVYVAVRHPLSRLAIASVLESIGANYGKRYATAIGKQLGLKPDQMIFFFGHGDTDVGHTEEIVKIIDACHLTAEDWDWMEHAARTAGKLYRAMYDEAFE